MTNIGDVLPTGHRLLIRFTPLIDRGMWGKNRPATCGFARRFFQNSSEQSNACFRTKSLIVWSERMSDFRKPPREALDIHQVHAANRPGGVGKTPPRFMTGATWTERINEVAPGPRSERRVVPPYRESAITRNQTVTGP
jgi:hypothetical protein